MRRTRGPARKLAKNQKESAPALYDAARIMALLGDKPQALDYLESAVATEFAFGHRVAHDAELETLRGAPCFKKLVASLQEIGPLPPGRRPLRLVPCPCTNTIPTVRLRTFAQDCGERNLRISRDTSPPRP